MICRVMSGRSHTYCCRIRATAKHSTDPCGDADVREEARSRDPGLRPLCDRVDVVGVLCLAEDRLRRYPAMQVMTLYVDRIVQLAEENQDVAVRIGHLADPTLRATRVGIVRRVVCGAPAYFETR